MNDMLSARIFGENVLLRIQSRFKKPIMYLPSSIAMTEKHLYYIGLIKTIAIPYKEITSISIKKSLFYSQAIIKTTQKKSMKFRSDNKSILALFGLLSNELLPVKPTFFGNTTILTDDDAYVDSNKKKNKNNIRIDKKSIHIRIKDPKKGIKILTNNNKNIKDNIDDINNKKYNVSNNILFIDTIKTLSIKLKATSNKINYKLFKNNFNNNINIIYNNYVKLYLFNIKNKILNIDIYSNQLYLKNLKNKLLNIDLKQINTIATDYIKNIKLKVVNLKYSYNNIRSLLMNKQHTVILSNNNKFILKNTKYKGIKNISTIYSNQKIAKNEEHMIIDKKTQTFTNNKNSDLYKSMHIFNVRKIRENIKKFDEFNDELNSYKLLFIEEKDNNNLWFKRGK
jgi:hypothetical protein